MEDVVIFAVPVPVDLARELAIADSSLTTENVTIFSDDSACSNQQQEDDDIAALETTLLINNESRAGLSDGQVLESASGTNTNPVSQIQVSDNCESIPCQLEYDIDSNKPDVRQTEDDNFGQLGEDTNSSEDACANLLSGLKPNVENDLLYEDVEPVDLCKLGHALWPKNTLMLADDNEDSFVALVAEHESYCKENAENVVDHTAFLSSRSGDTNVMQDNREALWPMVSKWLKESEKQSSRQLPRCSELIRGILVTDKKLHVNNNTSPPKLTTGDDKNAVSLIPVSSENDTQPVSSADNQSTDTFNDVGETRLDIKTKCSDQPPCPAFLTRAEILSLEFSGVPLSPKIISRIKELGLKRTDSDVMRPLVGKQQVTRKAPMPKQLQRNSGSTTVPKSTSALTENPVDSASTESTFNQALNHVGVKLDSALASADATASSDQTNVHDYTSAASSSKSDSIDAVSGKAACTVLSGPSTRQSDLTGAISCFRPISDTSTDAPVPDRMSGTKLSVGSFHSAAQGHLKPCATGGTPAVSSAVITPISVTTTTAAVSAVSPPYCVQAIKKSEPSTYRTSLAARERMPREKYDNSMVNGISEIPVDFSYHNDYVSPQPQQYIHRSKRNVIGRNQRRETDERFSTKERHRKSRKDNKDSAYCPSYTEIDPQRRYESGCSRCSRRRNVTGSAAYNQARNYAGCHQSRTSKHDCSSNMFDYYGYYGPNFTPTMNPSFLAAVSYSSYCLGAYNAHIHSMHYYNMLRQQPTANMWQHQDNYIRKMAKLFARR